MNVIFDFIFKSLKDLRIELFENPIIFPFPLLSDLQPPGHVMPHTGQALKELRQDINCH